MDLHPIIRAVLSRHLDKVLLGFGFQVDPKAKSDLTNRLLPKVKLDDEIAEAVALRLVQKSISRGDIREALSGFQITILPPEEKRAAKPAKRPAIRDDAAKGAV